MMNFQCRFISTVQGLLAINFLMFGLWSGAIAHEGHSHDKETKLPIVVNAFPTLTAVSENYELVGIVQSGQMTVFLDRFESNAPVVDAELEFDVAGTVVKAARNPDGTYLVNLPKSLNLKNSIPVTVTVLASSGADLLSGELVAMNQASQSGSSIIWILLMLIGLLLAILLTWLLIRRNPSLLVPIQEKISAVMRRYRK
jgi:hypothetical protein